MQFNGKHVPLEDVARMLSVDAVMEGSIARSGEKVRVTANLYQVSTRQHMWAETYERELGEDLSWQKDIARHIAAQIRTQIVSQPRTP